MTNVQFYFALGLPVFSILLVWLGTTIANNHAIGALSKRIDDLGKRIDDLGKHIDDQGKSLVQRIDDLRSEMRAGFDAVNGRIDRLEVRFIRIEDEVRKDHESRLARLEAKVFTSAA